MTKKYDNYSTLAFTLSEVLISLAILGIIAILTLPPVVENHKNKQWNTSANVFQSKLTIVLKQMLSNGDLNSFSETHDFVAKGLKKYIKIDKICDETKLTECFGESFITANNETVNTAELTQALNLGHENWDTKTVGIIFSNGISAIMAYNPNHEYYQDYIGELNISNLLAAVYDINTFKTPNSQTKDIRTWNAEIVIPEVEEPEQEITTPKVTCDDLINAGINTSCLELTSGLLFVVPTSASGYHDCDYNSCKNYCESVGLRMQTLEDAQARCAEGNSYAWWHWVDNGQATSSQAYAVYSSCARIEPFSINTKNYTCSCVAN